MNSILSDLKSGNFKKVYRGEKASLSEGVIPRWDLYNNDRALLGAVQTSRGCPYKCEFCDTIQYVGRKQRFKPVEHIIKELDRLYGFGYRIVFIADDNFTVNRKRAKEVLQAIKEWNSLQTEGMVSFVTQLSIDSAHDHDLLRLASESGLMYAFIGIETPNTDSLRESGKNHNIDMDIAGKVGLFVENGIGVMGGMIAGFDSDGPDIFDMLYNFAQAVPIPVFSPGALVAPRKTSLHERLAAEGRLAGGRENIPDMSPWNTNIVPDKMSRAELSDGIDYLLRNLYRADAFGERLIHFMEKVNITAPKGVSSATYGTVRQLQGRGVEMDAVRLIADLKRSDPDEKKMWSDVRDALKTKPGASVLVLTMLLQYRQIKYMLNKRENLHPATVQDRKMSKDS